MEEKIISIKNLEVNYKIAGSGPVILILHGWGGSSDSWIKVMEMLTNKGYKAICPDFPGFGKSYAPKNVWAVSDYISWLNEFIKSQSLESFSLLAHSFGGRIAIKFSVNYPQKIKSLILCNSAGIRPKLNFKNKMVSFVASIGNMIFSPKFLARLKDKARNIFYNFIPHKDYVKADGVMREIIKKIIEEDLSSYLSQIRVKTLIIWGQEDKMVPVNQSFVFKKQIEDSVLEILPDVGHSPHLEVPAKLSNLIVSFLTD